MGKASKSHPERLKEIIADLKRKNVEIIYKTEELLGYAPGLRKGEKGQIIIHKEASISAWEHEYRHFLDDEEMGFLGMESLFDSNYRVYTEINAYSKEIKFVKSLNGKNTETINKLKKNFFNEFNYIIRKFGEITDINIANKVKELKQL